MSPVQAAVLTAAACVMLVLAARWMSSRAASRKAVRRARRALAGEHNATALLTAAGFTVLDTQLSRTWTIHVDGAPVEIDLRCDAMVERAGRTLVAEVKTGDRAPKLATAATRRQLLEYAVAYGADGVLLVDPEAGLIHEVDFALTAPPPPPAPPPRSSRWATWFVAGIAVGAIAATLAS